MKGIVFSIKHGSDHNDTFFRRGTSVSLSLKRFFSIYGFQFFFFVLFILGVVLGAVSFSASTSAFIGKLDFLFLTNLDNRLEMSAFEIFSSCFVSDFIFVFFAFLLGFTVWGMLALPFLSAFKGFGIGISSALIVSCYSLSGLGFYILVVLPGTVMFLFAFLFALKEAFLQSVNLFRVFVPSDASAVLLRHTRTFLFRFFIILIFTAFSAIIDMILWVLFASMFNF